jgi:glycosyltransferase involved in cell wall biosynthesis
MSVPKVSVIIPTYNGAEYLGEAIQSVLDQTYPHFELIVVDDVSPDQTAQVVGKFDDPRIRYLVHKDNRGAVEARKTGVHASSGEIIAFLDQDDYFHPEKLQVHAAFLKEHPEIGVTYNSRFVLAPAAQAVRSIWEPPLAVSLTDLVLGYPFAPSDTVIRRELALSEDIWDQSFVSRGSEMIFNGGEIVFGGRLAFSGSKFASVERALTYRRYHPRRVFSDLARRCQAELDCQQIILDDPRCPAEVRNLRAQAYMNTYLTFSFVAFAQEERDIGQVFLREAIRLNPSLIIGRPCELARSIANKIAADDSVEIEEQLEKFFDHLPPEYSELITQRDWATARSYLISGTQAVLWDRLDEGRSYLARAKELGAQADGPFVQNLAYQLLIYQREFGTEAKERVILNLSRFLGKVVGENAARELKSSYFIDQAFYSYRHGDNTRVVSAVAQALKNDPRHILNRGVLSILFRSIFARRPVTSA